MKPPALTRRTVRSIAARIVIAIIAAVACLVAARMGGGIEEAPAMPGAAAAVTGADAAGAPNVDAPSAPVLPASGGAGAEGYEVVLRFTDIASEATVTAPNAGNAQKMIAAHWRKMRPAWSPSTGPGGRLLTSIALRTSLVETQWSMPNGATKTWSPDARVWNMNEGSYEQRDALIAPPPATFSFRVAIPQHARLTFSEGSINTMRDTTIFTIAAVLPGGETRELYKHRLAPAASRRWTDASCSLDALAGKTVELRFSTEAVPATSEEWRELTRERERTRRAEIDAGGADAAPILDPDGGAEREEMLTQPGIDVALWGSPTMLARTTPRAPYNVLWIVVDALRPDVITSFHDAAVDAAKLAAPNPPLEAHLPKVPGLTPSIDDLCKRGVRFTNAYSAGSWTRPGTLGMLAGARSSELGVDTQAWTLQQTDTARFYASDPPLLPLMARRRGMSTHAFVNNFFMAGYAPVGVEMGFEHTTDHRFRTRDTLEVTRSATSWLREHEDTRFFMFVNYNSPHEPYEPPPEMLARVPAPPAAPEDKMTRLYMAEAAKDDEAIGVLMESVASLGLRERTIVVLTSDHGETLSSAHDGVSLLDHMPVRYHHAASNYEETAHVPIVIVAPGLLPADRAVDARVRGTDIAPTVGELLGFEAHAKTSGRSMVALAKGTAKEEERVVVTEGRGTRAIMHGKYRLLVREGLARTTQRKKGSVTVNEELYDLSSDPGERVDLATSRPELVAEMRARLDAALKNEAVAGTAAAIAPAAATADKKLPVIRLRFASAGRAHRVSGTITIGSEKEPSRSSSVVPIDLGFDSFKLAGKASERVEVAIHAPAGVVGFDITVDPPTTRVTWDLYLEDKPLGDDAVFGGPYGLLMPTLRRGISEDAARLAAQATFLPPIDPRRDFGIFVVRDRGGDSRMRHDEGAPGGGDVEAAEEMARLLREWGYAHPGSGATTR